MGARHSNRRALTVVAPKFSYSPQHYAPEIHLPAHYHSSPEYDEPVYEEPRHSPPVATVDSDAEWFVKESENLRKNLESVGARGEEDAYTYDDDDHDRNSNASSLSCPNVDDIIHEYKSRKEAAELNRRNLAVDHEVADVCPSCPPPTYDEVTQLFPKSGLKPALRHALGFSTLSNEDVVFTAFLQFVGDEEKDWPRLCQRSERHIKGLERTFKCKVTLMDKPVRYRAMLVHELIIRGSCLRDVTRCKNALPAYLIKSLITHQQHRGDAMLGCQFHKR